MAKLSSLIFQYNTRPIQNQLTLQCTIITWVKLSEHNTAGVKAQCNQNINANAMNNFTNNPMNTFIRLNTKPLTVLISLDTLLPLRFLYGKMLLWQYILRLLIM